jgi:hypothetical protein
MRKIDFVFYNERAIREAVLDAREGAGKSAARNKNHIGDPTAAKAIRNVTPLRSVRVRGMHLEWPEHWLKVVDAVYAWCTGDRQVVAADRYHGVDYADTCVKLSISTKTYYNILNEVRQRAALCAVQLGVIKVC